MITEGAEPITDGTERPAWTPSYLGIQEARFSREVARLK